MSVWVVPYPSSHASHEPEWGGSDELLLMTPDVAVHGAELVPFSNPGLPSRLVPDGIVVVVVDGTVVEVVVVDGAVVVVVGGTVVVVVVDGTVVVVVVVVGAVVVVVGGGEPPVVNDVSSITKEVCSEEFSLQENFKVTLWPVYADRS